MATKKGKFPSYPKSSEFTQKVIIDGEEQTIKRKFPKGVVDILTEATGGERPSGDWEGNVPTPKEAQGKPSDNA